VRGGIGELPLLQVEGRFVEGLGDQRGMGGVRSCWLSEQVEHGGGAVAGEEFRPVGSGFFGPCDCDVVGEFLERGRLEGSDFKRPVAIRERVLDECECAEAYRAIDGAVDAVGGVRQEAGVGRPGTSLLQGEDAC
jgi:hypothetical protein